jgi:hypothetical protein
MNTLPTRMPRGPVTEINKESFPLNATSARKITEYCCVYKVILADPCKFLIDFCQSELYCNKSRYVTAVRSGTMTFFEEVQLENTINDIKIIEIGYLIIALIPPISFSILYFGAVYLMLSASFP